MLFVILTSAFAFGDSLALASSGGGKFDYEYLPSPSLGEASFQWNDTFSLTGLSDVTDARLSWPLPFYFTLSYTSSSVTVTHISTQATVNIDGGPFSVFEVSSLAPLGMVDYEIQVAAGRFWGTVGGPVAPAATPEPTSLLLVGSGIFGLGGVIRRKLSL
jgi:hypothetical protein